MFIVPFCSKEPRIKGSFEGLAMIYDEVRRMPTVPANFPADAILRSSLCSIKSLTEWIICYT